MFLFTVDVEDWYQVENLKSAISRDTWTSQDARVEDNTMKILDILDSEGGRGTFFVLGCIAKRHPKLIERIHAQGHEVASHGFNHELIYEQDFTKFRKDIRDSKSLLEDIIGDSVMGYRAPAFSLTDWALDILKETGYVYDSSVFPFKLHDRYGHITAHPKVLKCSFAMYDNGLLEVRLSMLKIMHATIPWSGGGYFRLMPYPMFRIGVNEILKRTGAFVFYIHPWEIDPFQPRIRSVKLQYRIRHYVNLKSTISKLRKLVYHFKPSGIKQVLEGFDSSPCAL